MAKIYPQSITGTYRTLKNYGGMFLLGIYFFLSWIRWDRGDNLPSQAILMDLPNRKAYLFSIEIWPQEAYYIAGLLICAAMGLFFVTSLFGRIWCGYTCPHTVFVDLFVQVEKYFQGDRNARMKLDEAPNSPEKRKQKFLTYLCWLLISFSFAFGWVCYFYDAPTLVKDLATFNVSHGGMAWLIGLTASTFFFAGYVRQSVCIYMCPYGRFQSAMLDNDSSVVTYHEWRGEPRGKPEEGKKLGDCIDCGKCVVVCPMGIDIRDGLQLPCIGCGLCIDACNTVMEKLDRPKYLIAYDSINSTKDKILGKMPKKNIFKLKTILFLKVFIIVSSTLLYTLATKSSISMAVLRDRNALFTTLPDGSIRNTYELKLHNKSSKNVEYNLFIEGLDNVDIKKDYETNYNPNNIVIELQSEEEKSITVFVKTTQKVEPQRKIFFHLVDNHSKNEVVSESVFITER